MRLNGFHHAAIEARDVEKVAAFFRDVLGLPEVVRHHRADGSLRSVWLASGVDLPPGAPFVAIEASTNGAPAGAGWFMVALAIDASARHRVRAALVERGVEIVKETRWTMYLKDPEGNLVGLSHHPHDAPADELPPAPKLR